MNKKESIKGIIFDLDGTLIDSALDFDKIKRDLNLFGTGIIEQIKQLPEPERTKKQNILSYHETKAAYDSRLYDGALELLDYLQSNFIKTAAVTRNSKKSWEIYSKKHDLVFDTVITRDDAEPKPSPIPFTLASRLLAIEPKYLLSVGDYKYELIGSKDAGIRTVLVLHNHNRTPDILELSDYVVHNLYELKDIIKELT